MESVHAEAVTSDSREPGYKRVPRAHRVVFVLVSLVVGGYYLWCAQATNEAFEWRYDNGGYYNMLGRAFAEGKLYLPLEPKPELLALDDPWDPARNEPFSPRDLVLYNRRYYLYHGATPAWLLFTPYRLLTRHDLPEAFAAFLFCFLGYLSSCGVLMRLLGAMSARPGLARFTLLLLALALCPALPFLLQRVNVYEVSIAGGYFCVSAGFWFLTRGIVPKPAVTPLAMAGLMLGLAAGCRPHLALGCVFGGLGLLWFLRRQRPLRDALFSRQMLAFALPVAACALAIAGYNYARFGNVFEFGMHWQMAGASYFRPMPEARNLLPGLYYLLACPPDFDRVFPFIRLVLRTSAPVGGPLPARYFLEPVAGLFAAFPAAVAGFVAPWIARRRSDAAAAVLTAVCALAAANILFVASLGLVSHRFEVDWLPGLVLAACVVLGSSRGGSRITRMAAAACSAALMYSIAVNLALGVQGPYDSVVQSHPAGYVRFGRWFGFQAQDRLLLNPRLTVEAEYEFPDRPGATVPLFAAGRFGSRYLLSAEMRGGNRARLVSAASPTSGNTAYAEVTLTPGIPVRVRLAYLPERRQMQIEWNGERVLKHDLPFLVTAPGQVTMGVDRAELVPTADFFPGKVTTVARAIDGAPESK
jgi:hypothetical protein